MEHHDHNQPQHEVASQTSASFQEHHHHHDGTPTTWWGRFKASMTMTMGMDHAGLGGREMARMMEEDIRRKFFFALILTVPVVLYSPMGPMLLGLYLPTPIPVPWMLFLLTTPVFFYAGWLFLYSSYFSLKERNLNMSVL